MHQDGHFKFLRDQNQTRIFSNDIGAKITYHCIKNSSIAKVKSQLVVNYTLSSDCYRVVVKDCYTVYEQIRDIILITCTTAVIIFVLVLIGMQIRLTMLERSKIFYIDAEALLYE